MLNKGKSWLFKIGGNKFLIYILAPYFLLLFIYYIFGFNMDIPGVFPDEYGYWSQARFLAGGNHINFYHAPYYYFGYPLFIAPAFWFFAEVGKIYNFVILINIILACSLYFWLFYFLRKIFNLPHLASSLIVFLSCLYPAFVARANFIASENLFVSFYVILVISLLYLLKKNNSLAALFFSFNSVFIYAIHSRAWLVPALAVIFLLFLCYFKKISKKIAVLSLVSILLFYIIVKMLNYYLMKNGWNATFDPLSFYVFKQFLGFNNLNQFLVTFFGQFLSLISGTFGLFLLGVYFILKQFRVRLKNFWSDIFSDKKMTVFFWLLLTSFSIMLASATVPIVSTITGSDARIDHFYYSRYNEGFLAIYISLALVYLFYKKKVRVIYIFSIILFLALVYSFFYRAQIVSLFNDIYSVPPIIVIFVYVQIFFGKFDPGLFVLLGLLIFSILIFVYRKNFVAGCLLLAIIFSFFNYKIKEILFPYNNYLVETSAKSVSLLKTIQNNCDIIEISYDYSKIMPKSDPDRLTWYYGHFCYPYHLPSVKFYWFDGRISERPQTNYAISSVDWPWAEKFGAELIYEDKNTGQTLWKINN